MYHGLMVSSVLRGDSSDLKEFCAGLVLGAPEGLCCCLHAMSGKLNALLFIKMECCGLHLPHPASDRQTLLDTNGSKGVAGF